MSEPNVAVLQPGAIFHARYEVVRCLKSGGMGAIYEVIHLDTRRRRALKTMLPGLLADGDLRDRFKHEATIAAEIESEHIVETFDAGFDADTGLPFLVMELLKGQDLGAMMEKRGKIPGTEVIALLYQAALALNKTHAAGVVHRDLKPENLFVVRRDDGSPRLKLLDFGIAKLIAHGPLAKTTRLVGSPLYMSTEQIKGEGTIGPRADLYSLGQIAYALLVGEAYWERESRATEAIYPLLLKIMLGAKEAATVRAKDRVELPAAFDAWFDKATNLEPEERFGTASELVDSLADALGLPRPRGTIPEIDDDAPPPPPAAKSERAPPAAPNTITNSAVVVQPPFGARRRVPILVGLAFVGLGVVVAMAMRRGGSAPAKADPLPAPVTAAATTATAAPPASSAPAVRPDPNPWVRIEPPEAPVLLGVSEDDAPREVRGFRPARGIHAPTTAYEIQQHEVTWDELDPWLMQHESFDFDHPSWVPREMVGRAKLPATGVTWKAARAYCKDIGGSLPTEEQWEFAARGTERRPHAWGSQRIDLLRVRAFAAEAQSDDAPKTRAPVAPVMTMDQDQTPGDSGSTLYDMTGNAMEWTSDLYRESSPHVDETWTEEGGVSYRAVRGLPLDAAVPHKEPAETATWRTPVCATGPCPKKTAAVLQYVGFRCVKNAERARDVDKRPARREEPPPIAEPTAEPAPKSGKHAPAAEAHSKAGTAQPRPTAAIITGDSVYPARPSQASVSVAVGAVMGAAKACVAGADFDTFARLNFGSNGVVTSVNVTGWANAKGKSACVQGALSRVRITPFTESSFSTRVTIRP